MVEVVQIGREHGRCGRRANAEDGQHEDRGRDAYQPKGPTRTPAAPETCLAGERPGLRLTQPAVDALLLRQVLDAVRDPAGLRRAKPPALLPFEQAFDRRPGLEGHE